MLLDADGYLCLHCGEEWPDPLRDYYLLIVDAAAAQERKERRRELKATRAA